MTANNNNNNNNSSAGKGNRRNRRRGNRANAAASASTDSGNNDSNNNSDDNTENNVAISVAKSDVPVVNSEGKKKGKKRRKDNKANKAMNQQQQGQEMKNGDGGDDGKEEGTQRRPKKRQKTKSGDGGVKKMGHSTAEERKMEKIERFSQLDLVPELKQAIADVFHEFNDIMTPIQSSSIPIALQTNGASDIIAQASTGSGKTIAFLVPVLNQLCRSLQHQKKDSHGNRSRFIVLSPARELALQTLEVTQKLLDHHAMHSKFGLKAGIIVGGVDKRKDFEVLRSAHVVVATPGRLVNHARSGAIDMSTVHYIVLDEADMLLDAGFERQIRQIVTRLPKDRTMMLFSATMSDKINKLAALSMRPDPIKVGFEESNNVRTLKQRYVRVPADKKIAALLAIVHANQDKKMIVFASTKASVKFICMMLNRCGIMAVDLRGNIGQTKRNSTFRDFSKQSGGVLVATDVASRGLDIPDVDLVIQVDFPDHLPQYFHRAGRTARAGKKGTALLMLNDAEIRVVLGRLHCLLKEGSKNMKEKLLEYNLPAGSDELDQFQQQIIDAVKTDVEMHRLSEIILWQSEWTFPTYIKRYQFKETDFCLSSVMSSFGIETAST